MKIRRSIIEKIVAVVAGGKFISIEKETHYVYTIPVLTDDNNVYGEQLVMAYPHCCIKGRQASMPFIMNKIRCSVQIIVFVL
jgi:hypothetical protein